MYKCGGCEFRPGGVKESNKREPGKLQGPLARRNSRIALRPVLLGPRIPLGQNSNSGCYRQRLSALFPRTFRLLWARGKQGERREGWEEEGGKGRGCPAERREDEDNSPWLRRLRSFRALTRLIVNLWKRALRSAAESIHFKRHRAGHATRFRRSCCCFGFCRGHSACLAR